jgi:bacterioferritin-associated ferredoxin
MIVCHCVGVTDGTIRNLIEAGAASVGEITRRCGAGRCCQPCREEIASLLEGCSASRASVTEFTAAECA